LERWGKVESQALGRLMRWIACSWYSVCSPISMQLTRHIKIPYCGHHTRQNAAYTKPFRRFPGCYLRARLLEVLKQRADQPIIIRQTHHVNRQLRKMPLSEVWCEIRGGPKHVKKLVLTRSRVCMNLGSNQLI
jgi:hypothetical protein